MFLSRVPESRAQGRVHIVGHKHTYSHAYRQAQASAQLKVSWFDPELGLRSEVPTDFPPVFQVSSP